MKRMGNGITNQRSYFYQVMRPDGRPSTYVFRSKFRAAEHVMRAAHVDHWDALAVRGVRVVAV